MPTEYTGGKGAGVDGWQSYKPSSAKRLMWLNLAWLCDKRGPGRERFCHLPVATCIMRSYGSVAEWLKAAVLKTADGGTRS